MGLSFTEHVDAGRQAGKGGTLCVFHRMLMDVDEKASREREREREGKKRKRERKCRRKLHIHMTLKGMVGKAAVS